MTNPGSGTGPRLIAGIDPTPEGQCRKCLSKKVLGPRVVKDDEEWCHLLQLRPRMAGEQTEEDEEGRRAMEPEGGDMKSSRFGRLFVLGSAGSRDGRVMWCCLCDCGTLRIIRHDHLKDGRTLSCGCYGKERRSSHGHTNGGKESLTYNSWRAMRDRCSRPNARNYRNYGGRGICVCEAWQDSFAAFLTDMGERPPGMTLDRIDVHGNYEPGNCRWATPTEQEANKQWRHRSHAPGARSNLPAF